MSRRLIRVQPAEAPSIGIGTEINAVLQSGKTFFGKLTSASGHFLTLQDMRGVSHKIELHQLFEIILDPKTPLSATSN